MLPGLFFKVTHWLSFIPTMLHTPIFKAKYHHLRVEGQGVFLVSETEKHVLEGEILWQLIPLVDGYRSAQALIEALEEEFDREDIQDALELLESQGYVLENQAAPRETTPIMAQSLFWGEMGLTPHQAQRTLASLSLKIIALSGVDATPFIEACQQMGFTIMEEGVAPLWLVLTDDYQDPALAQINAQCLADGVPWLLAKPTGLLPMLGPLFRPGHGACWACLNQRLEHQRGVERYLLDQLKQSGPLPVTQGTLPGVAQRLAYTTAVQLAQVVALGTAEEIDARIATFNIYHLAPQYHFVTQRPQCEACGDPEAGQVSGLPIYWARQPVGVVNGNGTRREPPEATFARYAHHVSPLTGIVDAIIPVPWNGQGPIHVMTAGHNFAMRQGGLHQLKAGLRQQSAGKGRTEAQTRTSALCEALERYSGLYKPQERQRRSSYADFAPGEALHPDHLQHFSKAQFAERDQPRDGRFTEIPQSFDEQAEISWTPIWSHTQQCTRWAPTAYLMYGNPDEAGAAYCLADSNGNAAGSCREDAALQGFFEVIERDAVALWWYNRLRRPGVDLASLEDAYVDETVAFYAAHQRECWVLDVTADTGIPSFVAISARTDVSEEAIVMGFGAHLDARIAINRALTELNQMAPAVLDRHPDGSTRYRMGDALAQRWWREATRANQPYLLPQGELISASALPRHDSQDIREDLMEVFGRVEALGYEVLVMDQTLPDVELPVVKVLVPGFRHFWQRLGPGRLYEVPVAMGWQNKPTLEADMNPFPMFL